jgi:hypothetical protein
MAADHDPRLGLAQSAQRMDKVIAASDDLWSQALGDGELAKAFPLYYLQLLADQLMAAGLEDPIELNFAEIPDAVWWPLIASATTATGLSRLGERFGPLTDPASDDFWSAENVMDTDWKLTLVFTKNRGKAGDLRVRVSLARYRLCDWRLDDLLDEQRWCSAWNRTAKLCLASQGEVDQEVRRDYREHMRRKLGIDQS